MMEHDDTPSEPVPSDGARAIHRALDIARHVAQLQRSGATLARVSKASGLSRSTAFRLLRALTDERMLHFRQCDRTYHIGPLAFELGLAGGDYADLREEWREAVSTLAARTGLTSYLMARSGDEAVCLLCAQGSAAIRAMPVAVGQRVPLGIGAGGLVILAALDDSEVRRIAAGHEKSFAAFPSRALSIEQVEARVRETRQRGFSISQGTVAAGVSGIGVLVPYTRPHIQLALTLSAVFEDVEDHEARTFANAMISIVQRQRTARASVW